MTITDELIASPARRVAALLEAGALSPLEALEAIEARAEAVDGVVHALCTRCPERARGEALRLGALPPAERGPLMGLPIAIKDLTDVAGVRSTHGSRVYAEHAPEASDELVLRLEIRGGVVHAKTNTPEFGAGGLSWNDLFPETANPHAPDRAAGGSSGGSAAALASGSAWLATGSDMAGSLRTPASFCGVTSLRPSPGLIDAGPSALPFEALGQEGPMARDLGDLALLADAMATRGGRAFRDAVERPRAPRRVAISDDLGIAAVDAEVAAIVRRLAEIAADAGAEVVEAAPPLEGVDLAFDRLRALAYGVGVGGLGPEALALVKPEVAWNVAQGLALDGGAIRAALAAQGRLVADAARFMDGFDLLICPAAAISPPPLGARYVGHAEGAPIADYYRWLRIAYATTVTALPVITLPVGRTAAGLPVGAQLVGRPRGEAELMRLARFFEDAIGWPAAPIDPRHAILHSGARP